MKALFKNIQGLGMVILITLAMTAVVLTVFGVSFEVSGSVEKSAFASDSAFVIAIAFTIVFASVSVCAFTGAIAFASAFASACAFAFAFVIASVSVSANVNANVNANISVIAFTGAIVIAIAIAIAIAIKYKVKLRFCLYIFITETILVVFAMTIWLPYLALIIAGLSLAIATLLAESKLRLWLTNNPPPEILFHETMQMVGGKFPYGAMEVVASRERIPDPFVVRLHRRTHSVYMR